MPSTEDTGSAGPPELGIELESPAFLSGDRSQVYRQLRDEAPAFAFGPPGNQMWLLSRHADVQAVLRDPDGRVNHLGVVVPPWMPDGPAARRLRGNMSQADRPIHTRLRSAVGPLFTVRKSEELRHSAKSEIDRELESILAGSGHFDAVHALAARVPKGVLRLLIGMPDEDWPRMIELQHEFLMIFSPFPLPSRQQARLDEVTQQYFDYFDALLGRTAEPTELVKRLLDSEASGELSHDEVLSVMHTVLDAGFETTRTSISNAVERFVISPQVFDQLRYDPTLVDNGVEEVLRTQPPVEMGTRVLTKNYRVADGTVVPANTRILAAIGAANSDERVFVEPQRFDITRVNAAQHLTFGGGLHHCLGAPLARLQVRETVRALAQRFAGFELDGEATRHESLMFPSLISLPIHAKGAR